VCISRACVVVLGVLRLFWHCVACGRALSFGQHGTGHPGCGVAGRLSNLLCKGTGYNATTRRGQWVASQARQCVVYSRTAGYIHNTRSMGALPATHSLLPIERASGLLLPATCASPS
jgi:hypothetical protein